MLFDNDGHLHQFSIGMSISPRWRLRPTQFPISIDPTYYSAERDCVEARAKGLSFRCTSSGATDQRAAAMSNARISEPLLDPHIRGRQSV